MMDVKLTRSVSVQSDKAVLLPLSWSRKNVVQAFLDHEFCEEKQVHTRLRVFVKPI